MIGFIVIVGGCDNSDEPSVMEPTVVEDMDPRVEFDLQVLGDIPYPPDNLPRQERIALGRLIFFDPIISGEKNVACGTCHHPAFGFADGRQFGAGVSGSGLGPSRILSKSTVTGDPIDFEPRNSPTVWNAAFNGVQSAIPSHVGLQFMDGRAKGLEEQAKGPITSRVEMKGDPYTSEVAMDSVVARLRAIPEYVTRFRDAFPDEASTMTGDAIVNEDTYGRAIGAYERELVTRNSAYDRYVQGDDNALNDLQKKGLELFFTKAKCASCHNGPMFSDYQFVVQGVPQEGGGKAVITGDDTGREEFTKNPADRYAFRTLTLRNIELTAPYMHDGVLKTLEDVVRFYNDGAQPRHPQITDDMLPAVLKDPLDLTEDEIKALVAFMKALTDHGDALPAFMTTVPAKVPSGLMPVFGVNGLGSGKTTH